MLLSLPVRHHWLQELLLWPLAIVPKQFVRKALPSANLLNLLTHGISLSVVLRVLILLLLPLKGAMLPLATVH
ncbi:hypothetical protein [Neisseria dentiae]|uniref:hypothetical protein n=1 Tax=Neisseria dentiae TaxID=194197 RepID=UPI001FE5DAF1|nr:hypothetical protein [Neisseria dentiae]